MKKDTKYLIFLSAVCIVCVFLYDISLPLMFYAEAYMSFPSFYVVLAIPITACCHFPLFTALYVVITRITRADSRISYKAYLISLSVQLIYVICIIFKIIDARYDIYSAYIYAGSGFFTICAIIYSIIELTKRDKPSG